MGRGQSWLQDFAWRPTGIPYLMKASSHLALSPSSPSHYLVMLAFLEAAKRCVLTPLFPWSWGPHWPWSPQNPLPAPSPYQRLLFQLPLPTNPYVPVPSTCLCPSWVTPTSSALSSSICTECRSPPLAFLFQSISKCLLSTGSLSEASRPAAFSLTWVLIGDADYQGPIPDRLTQEPDSGLGVVSNVCCNKLPGDSDTASVWGPLNHTLPFAYSKE